MTSEEYGSPGRLSGSIRLDGFWVDLPAVVECDAGADCNDLGVVGVGCLFAVAGSGAA